MVKNHKSRLPHYQINNNQQNPRPKSANFIDKVPKLVPKLNQQIYAQKNKTSANILQGR